MIAATESSGQIACPPHECDPCETKVRFCNQTDCDELNLVWGYQDLTCSGTVGIIPIYKTDPNNCIWHLPRPTWITPSCFKFCIDGNCICPSTLHLLNPDSPGIVDPWGPMLSWDCQNFPVCIIDYLVLSNSSCCDGELRVEITIGYNSQEAEFRFYCN